MFAFVASVATIAQTNLAQGKTVTLIYAAGGSVTADDLAKVTDGNTGTNVILPNNGEKDIAAISIDLTDTNASTAISTITVAQDGRHATTYNLYGTNTAPETYATNEALTTAKASWTLLAEAPNDNNAGGDNNVYVKAYKANSNTGFRYIVFVPTAFAYNVSLRQISVYGEYTPELTTFTLTAAQTTINAGATTTTSVTKLDQVGVEFEGTPTYTSSNTSVATVAENGTITGVAAGTATITATLGSKTATVDITVEAAIEWPTTAPAAPTGSVSVVYDGTTGTWSDAGWGWGSTQSDIVIDGKTCRKGENLGSMQIPNDLKDYTDYKKLVVDVWSASAHTLIIYFESEETKVNKDLTAGWNQLEIATSAVTTPANVNYLTFQYSESSKTGALVFSNIYYSKEEAADPVVISAVTDGVVKVTGTLKAADTGAIDDINNVDAMLIDLSGVTKVDDAVTISPKNPNALVRVPGTVTDNNATADAKVSNLTAPNQVVITEWVFPVAQLQVTDANGAKYWDGEGCTNNWIATNTKGWKITRSIAGEAYVTACYPAAVATIPEGLTAYELSGYDATAKELTFTAVTAMAANKPYVIRNTKSAAVTLEVEGTGDFSIDAEKATAGNTTADGVTMQGNYRDLTTDGNQFILNGGEVKKGNGAKIGSFRAYFTGLTVASARAIFFDGDGVTGISKVNIEKVLDGRFYNLQGQEVKNPTKGIYIVNGHKVIIK